jgi:autotransporter translocation and assembly factor TamB
VTIAAVLAGGVVLALITLRQPAVGTWLANLLLSRLVPLPRATAHVASVRGDWIGWLELHDLRIVRGDTLLVSADTLRARYQLGALVLGRLDVPELSLARLHVTADARDTTRRVPKRPPLTFGQMLQGRFYTGLPIHVARLRLDAGTIGGRAREPDTGFRITRLHLRARDLRLGRGLAFRVDSLAGALHPGAGRRDSLAFAVAASLTGGRAELGRLRFLGLASDVEGHGALAIGALDTLQSAGLTLSARPLSLADLAGFSPGVPLEGELNADIALEGTRTDRLSGTMRASAAHARIGALALDAFQLSGSMAEGSLEAGASARLAGATITLEGSGTPLGARPAYALELRCDRPPARLGDLAWWPSLAERVDAKLALNVKGTGYSPAVMDVTGNLLGDVGSLGLDAHASVGRTIEWELRSLAFDHLDVTRLAGSGSLSSVSGRLRGSGSVARGGPTRAVAELEIAPSTVNGLHVRDASVSTRLAGTELTGSLAVETDAGALEVGSFAVSTAAGGASHVRDARFRDLDLARLLGQPALASGLGGSITAEARDVSRLLAPQGAASADVRLTLAPSTLRGQAIRSGDAHVTLARGNAHAESRLATAAGSVRLSADARPFDRPASARLIELRFERLDLAAWTGTNALRSDLAGTVSGAFRARASADLPARGSAALSLERSRLGGAKLDGGELRATLGEAHAHVEGSLRTAGSTLALGADVSRHDRSLQGTASCGIPFALLAAVAGRDSLPSRGGLFADARFRLDPGTPLHAEGSVTGSGGVGRSRLDTLAAAFRIERGLLTVDTVLARSNLATVRGAGTVALGGTTGTRRPDFGLHAEVGDVTPLRELLGIDTLALASGSLDFSIAGAETTHATTLRAELRSLAWNGLRLSGAGLTSEAVLGRGWRPIDGSARLHLRQLQGLPLPIRDAAAEVQLRGATVAFVAGAATDTRSSARVRGRAAFDSLGALVTLDSLSVDADTARWRLTRPSRLALSATRWHVDDLELRSRGGRLGARGGIDRRGEQDFDLELDRVTLPGLAAWVGRRDLSAFVDGRLRVRGPASRPSAEGQAALALYTAGEPAGSLGARLSWAERRARVDGAFATPKADSLSWSAQLPLVASLALPEPGAAAAAKPPLAGPVRVHVLASRFPLASLAPFLDPLAVGTPSGTLDVDARLDGDERALAGSGQLEIAGGVFPLPVLGVSYRDVTLRAEFSGDRLRIQRAGASSGKGTLEASGEVRFASVTRVEPKLHVKTRRFVLSNSNDLKATATCELDVTGTLDAPVVKGSVTVGSLSLYFTQPDLAATDAGSDVRLTPADVRMMEETFGYVAPHAPALPLQLYDASDLDLAIKMERDNWIRQRVPPKMAVALTGDFKLRKRPHAEPELFGKIEPIPNRGYVQQFARSFDITGGEVLLNGRMNDHAVSIHAQFKPESGVESVSSTEVVVKLDVEGTPDHLKLTLSSDPPMSEAEIVNFIATGHAAAAAPTTSNGTSNSSLLRDIGLSQLSGPAESVAQEAVGLDVLEVRYDPLRGATLVAGRYVDPQLYVGFRSPLDYNQNTSTNTSNSTVNSTAFEVEYAISRWLVFNMQGETAKLRSFFRARRAY